MLHLKKLELQGFKSFPDKTEIKFEDNITAIVGPNGSGKSNISDAIRWVLGEQSIKNLRGSKMEDVIFSGTRRRKALSFAEVSIYFDNGDRTIPIEYNEVVVTRRMFRSGESEYYLNKSACRLKDIRAMFMDTGIGKDGYSIIGQGRIDEILSDKPEDRRSIFEEAAGIIKYKTKKENSEKKLENTEDNLTRINDLISEISSNNKKLKKESQKADKFIKTFEELKKLEANIYIRDIKELEEKKEKIRENNKGIQENLDENNFKKENKEGIFKELKDSMDYEENTIENLRSEREKVLEDRDKSKNKLSLLTERESFNKENITRLKEEIKKIDSRNLKLENELETLEIYKEENLEKYERLLSDQSKSKNQLEEIEKDISTLEEEIENRNRDTNKLYEKIADKKGKLNNLDLSNENIEDKKREYEKENKKLYGEIEILDKKVEFINSQSKELEGNLENLYSKKKFLEENYQKTQVDLNNNSELIKEKEIKLGKARSNYNLYKNMQNSYEGYFKSVKNLLIAIKNNKINNDGFYGLVVDLLKVDKKYETAINIALGGNLQNVVVGNEINAKEMINYLKEKKLGRVTFLPLSTVKGSEYNLNNYKSEDHGILGIASSLVKYDSKYKNIFKSLLGRTIIIDNIDNAIKFSKKTGYRYRIVTLDGEVLNPGGSLSGGSYKSNISILNRKHKINEIKNSLDKLEEELKRLKEVRERLYVDIETINEKLIKSSNNIEKINKQIIKNENDDESYCSKKDYLLENIEKNKHQILTIEHQRKEKVANSIKDEEFLKTNEEKFNNMRKNTLVKKEKLTDLNSNRENLIKKINKIEISKNTIDKENISYDDSIENKLFELEENKNSKSIKAKEISLIEQKLLKLLEEKKELDNDISNREKKELEFKENINKKIKEKNIKLNKFYKEQDKLKNINENISKLEKAENDNSLSISKLELRKENIIEKLSSDYKLSLEQAYLLEQEIENIKLAKERIKNFKKDIKDLGNINLNSIEEYKRVNSRLEFMETQRNDLIDSKGNLEEIIKDMEKIMRSNFLESFHEINENFKEVFKELFDGGEAKLELATEENNILSSGIDIKAKPPGKVLQSLSLLSGGEKSLVAVALLFAILKTKPAPFSILDEIDAALDDANINRYTSYLKKINKKTQFILITHRKISMEIANVLYGVTMEEEGISKIISMELKDNKEELVG